MKQEEKELLKKVICEMLLYGIKLHHEDDYGDNIGKLESINISNDECVIWNYSGTDTDIFDIEICKPYLRPLSSMTEEEAMEIVILHNIKDILSVKVTSDYIDVIVDDSVCSTERRTIWYDEMVSSIKCFDWLNEHHFDYRGLIKMGLALEAPEEMYDFK